MILLKDIHYKDKVWKLPDVDKIESPIPLSTFVLKVSNECNLACTYCYFYNSVDKSWKDKPPLMNSAVIDQTLFRIFEHVRQYKVPMITIVLHGGEPLLAGLKTIEYIFEKTIEINNNSCHVEFLMQTNGLLLDRNVILKFYKYKAKIGISLDGNEDVNRYRIKKNKKASFPIVENNVKLFNESKEGKKVFSGILSVINPSSNPIEVYKYLSTHKPISIDFILPIANYNNYPVGKSSFSHTLYGDWLIELFNYWFYLSTNKIRIIYFYNIIMLLLGGESEAEVLGHPPVNVVTIESNGEIEGIDTLKSSFEYAPCVNRNVFNSSFEEVLFSPIILSRMQGVKNLCQECLNCSLINICGGGYLPHRYSEKKGFLNPSIYCQDILKLIWHIRNALVEEMKNDEIKKVAMEQ